MDEEKKKKAAKKDKGAKGKESKESEKAKESKKDKANKDTKGVRKAKKKETKEAEVVAREMTFHELVHEVLSSNETFNPQWADFKVEFGDGEAFLVDGDALLWRAVKEAASTGPGAAASTHVSYLVEKAIKAVADRGGLRAEVVFFKVRDDDNVVPGSF